MTTLRVRTIMSTADTAPRVNPARSSRNTHTLLSIQYHAAGIQFVIVVLVVGGVIILANVMVIKSASKNVLWNNCKKSSIKLRWQFTSFTRAVFCIFSPNIRFVRTNLILIFNCLIIRPVDSHSGSRRNILAGPQRFFTGPFWKNF